jgi:prepilin-type N-terminal cleavage/methylation domain-containing protein
MRAPERHPRAVRRGFTVIEVSLALAVLLAASILLTQFLVASSQQRKLADQRRLALEELSNRLERVMAAKWEDANVAAIEGQELSQAVQENLPAAKLTADITDEPGGSTSGKRVRLEISWEQHGQRVSPIGLAGWKFPPREARP